jgi:nucleotide-binding universal stress UspA family protein
MKTAIEECEPPINPQRAAASRASTATVTAADRKQSLQIKTILVPLDFSRASMQALKYTIPLAEEFKATIHLVHVQLADELTAISRAGRMMLDCADAIAFMQDRLAEVQREHDVRFWPDNYHVVSGRPFEEICKLAGEIETDLIVLSTRGHSGLKHVLLGSTTERVVRYAPCPVLVPRGKKYRWLISNADTPKAGFKLRKILVPVDFSQCSLAGANYAALLAERFGTTLRLFHALYPYSEVVGVDRIGSEMPSLMKAAQANAREQMGALAKMDFLHGVKCETEIRIGYPVDEICGETNRPDVDLVVTSTHGRTGITHALIGSVAEHVVRYAECPVITVPSRLAGQRS